MNKRERCCATHPTLVRRSNQSHPTFPVLLYPDDIPLRASLPLSLLDQQRLPWASFVVLDKLIFLLGQPSLPHSGSPVASFLRFALKLQSPSLGF